MPVTALQRWI